MSSLICHMLFHICVALLLSERQGTVPASPAALATVDALIFHDGNFYTLSFASVACDLRNAIGSKRFFAPPPIWFPLVPFFLEDLLGRLPIVLPWHSLVCGIVVVQGVPDDITKLTCLALVECSFTDDRPWCVKVLGVSRLGGSNSSIGSHD